MSSDTIAPVEGTSATKTPSLMDLWKASLSEPDDSSASSDQDSRIQQLMSDISQLLPQLMAMLAKGADGGNTGGGGQPSGGSSGGVPAAKAAAPAGGAAGGHMPPPWQGGTTPGGSGGGSAAPGGAGAANGAPPAGAAGAGSDVPAGAGSNPPAGAGAPNATPAATQPTPADPGTGAGSQGGSSGGSTTSGGGTPAASGAPGVTKNAGGVDQAAAVSGVSPDSTKVVNTGTGSDKVYNVTNSTGRTESFTYSVQGQPKGETITLEPGKTGTFVAGSGDIGVRITPTKADGSASPNEVLYEDGGSDNGQDGGVGNADISKVDGNKDAYGNAMNMTVTLSDGRTAGDGDAIHAYAYSTDDAASMGLAGDPSKTANIDLSDA